MQIPNSQLPPEGWSPLTDAVSFAAACFHALQSSKQKQFAALLILSFLSW